MLYNRQVQNIHSQYNFVQNHDLNFQDLYKYIENHLYLYLYQNIEHIGFELKHEHI